MISLILPIRNRAGLFKPTLDSYVAQTMSPSDFEIIIVDQQSDDGLVDLLKNYRSKLNFRLYDIDINSGTIKPNSFGGLTNPALPQNFGVKQAKGDIIVLTSPETVFARDNLSVISKKTKTNTFLYGHVVNANHNKFNSFEMESLKQIKGNEYCGPNKHPFKSPWAFFIGAMKKDDFIKLGGIEEMFMLGIGCDDTEFGMRVLAASFKIELGEDIFGIHQSHDEMKMPTEQARQERGEGLGINRSTYYTFFENNEAWRSKKRVVGNVGREFGVAKAKLIIVDEIRDDGVIANQDIVKENKPISELFAQFLSKRLSDKFMQWLDDNRDEVFPELAQPTPTITVERQRPLVRRPNNVMLHINQAFWRGGSILFMRDMARAYPEFHHITCFFYDSREDFDMGDEFRYEGIEICQIDELTLELVRQIDPVLMVFHNTEGKKVEGEWPYDWLKRWPLMAVHHNKSWPAFHAELDVFVSEAVLRPYEKVKSRMNWKLIPPCIDLSSYEKIERKRDNDRCVVGKLTSKYHTRFPTELIDILEKVQKEVPDCGISLIGGADYYKDTKLNNCEMPPVGSKTPEEFYKGFDIFIHRNKAGTVDSWGRVISEAMASGLPVVCENKGGPAEQINHGKDGFLCNNDEEFVECIIKLAGDPALRYEIGMKARKKASAEFGINRFRRETIDMVMKAALGML